MKSVTLPLPKSVLVPLGLTAAERFRIWNNNINNAK